MSSKEWRIDVSSSPATYPTCDYLNEGIVVCYDDPILIWYDASINKHEPDDRYTLSQLQRVIKQVVMYTEEQSCLEFIHKFRERKKLFVIVSGLVGRNFVPKIDQLSNINSIYVFCGRISTHEAWAQKFEKIQGVFNQIVQLCQQLERDKQNFEQDQIRLKLLDFVSKQFASPTDRKNFKTIESNDNYQPNNEIPRMTSSAVVPLSSKVTCSTMPNVESHNNLHGSETVIPYVQYKQQMEFSDTGIWPCICVIDSTRGELFHHLHSTIDIVKYFHSIESFLQHVHQHSDDPHFVALSNPTNQEHLLSLIARRIRKIYIYCSDNRVHEFDTWHERDPAVISVLQHLDSLIRLILWDLSACIVDIGNYYDHENKKILAQARYRYAYRLHLMINGNLNNRIEMLEHSSSASFNN